MDGAELESERGSVRVHYLWWFAVAAPGVDATLRTLLDVTGTGDLGGRSGRMECGAEGGGEGKRTSGGVGDGG